MKFAVSKQSMTPTQPVFMAGFGGRTRKSEGVLDELYIKTVLLSAGRDLLIVVFDALGADRGFVLGVKEALYERFGLEAADVLLHFTHTHASLHLTGEHSELRRGNYSLGQDSWHEDSSTIDYTEDVVYYRWIRDTVVALVKRCYAELQPGSLKLATGRTRAAISRRRMAEDGVQWAPAPDAEIDDELTVLTLTDEQDQVKAVLFNLGCHPTAMGSDNYLLSSEFVGHACKKLEEERAGEVVVFLQGSAGDLKPRHSVDGDGFKSCTPEEMRAAGDQLAGEVSQALAKGTFVGIEGPFRSMLASIDLNTAPPDELLMASLLSGESGEYYRRAAQRTIMAERSGIVKTKLPLYVQTWMLSERVVLVALESEIPTEYSLKLKRDYPDKLLVVLGYSNGVYSYIPTRKILEEGGYEADHPFTIGFKSRFVQETEELILHEVSRQMDAERLDNQQNR
ncbi:MAG: hypothetical protein K0R67_562 [Paenibacillus sp.]|jgi:hypothetical protein|nr:hypothetical protein [Paenibacillus sp.]